MPPVEAAHEARVAALAAALAVAPRGAGAAPRPPAAAHAARASTTRAGVAPAGADPGDGGAVADPVRAADGDVVRAHLGRAVDPAQRDRHAVGAADAGADGAGAGADDRGDGADRPAHVRRDGARAGDGRGRRRRQRRDASPRSATAADRGKEPLREFILKHTDPRDRASFLARDARRCARPPSAPASAIATSASSCRRS